MSLVLTPPELAAPAPVGDPGPRPGRFAAWWVRWRLALRLARRDALRAKGRTTLVMLMIGLPVLAIAAGDTLYRSSADGTFAAADARLGSADALVVGVSRERVWIDPVYGDVIEEPSPAVPPWTADEVLALLPDGSELVERSAGRIAVRTELGYAAADGFADDLTHPLREGAFSLLDGRAPTADGEVAISQGLARRGIEVGSTVELTRENLPLTVVGVLRPMPLASTSFVVLPPASAGLLDGTSGADDPTPQFFVGVPGGLDWPAVRELNGEGLSVLSREVLAAPPPASEYVPPGYPQDFAGDAVQVAVIVLVVAALVLEVVLLAGPAFAVGLRRQRRDLALLAAAGGSSGDVRRTVLASGVLLGGTAAAVGAVLGIPTAWFLVPVLEERTGAAFPRFEVPVLDLAGVVAVGVLAGLLAALVPARQAARTDVVRALTGRRGEVRTSWRLPVFGLVLVGLGLVLCVAGVQATEVAVAAGAVSLILGVVATTPWLVGRIAPLAPRLPVPARLAVRDATRNRSRTAPAVAAVTATVAGVTVLAVASASDSAQSRRDYQPLAPMGAAVVQAFDADEEGWVAVRAAVEEHVPGRTIHDVRTIRMSEDDMQTIWVGAPGCDGPVPECSWWPEGAGGSTSMFGEVVVLDEPALLALATPELREDVREAWSGDRVLVLGRGAVDASGQVRLEATRYDGRTDRSLGGVRLPATEVEAPMKGDLVDAPALVVVPPVLEDRLPVDVATSQLIVGGPGEPVTRAEQQRLQEALGVLSSESYVDVERGWSDDLGVPRLLLVLVGGALVLVATLTATGLAVADARPDHATLAAVGAAPRTRRLMAMGSAAVIGVLGAVLGVLAGLGPGIAIAHPLTAEAWGVGVPIVVVPWDLLAAVAVGVPLLAVVVTGLAVRSRLPMVRRIAQ